MEAQTDGTRRIRLVQLLQQLKRSGADQTLAIPA